MRKGRDILHKTLRRTFFTLNHPKPPSPPPPPPKMDHSERYCYEPELRWNPKVEEYFVKAYGAEHFARISKALTRPSCYSCIRVNTLRSTSDDITKKLLDLQEREWQHDNSEGVDPCHVSDDASKASLDSTATATPQKFSISKCDISGLDYVLFVKGSGPHTIDYGFKEDKPLKEVLVSRKCAEAVLRGAQVYVPGVLACSAHVEKGESVAVSIAVEQPGGDGNWHVGFTRGTVLQGSETDPYHSERRGLYIGQGTAMLSRAGMFRASHGVAVDMFNRVFKLPSFHNILEGEIFLQNLPSIITAHVLDPQEGERILDMCAAPGGKTTAIAILMKDNGEVIAADRSHNKVLGIQKLAAEIGLKCITTCKLDALKSVRIDDQSESNDASQSGENESSGLLISRADKISDTGLGVKDGKVVCPEQSNEPFNCKTEPTMNNQRRKNGPGRSHCLGERVEKSKGFFPNSFDRVLLDGPCSALGLRPRLFTGQETFESLRAHATYQRRMFDQAVQLVRPGGVIVYSTCTINPGENESLVRYALDRYKFLSLASQHPRVGGPGLVGSCQLSDGYKEEWLKPGEEDLVQRFDPSSPLDTIGFFIAKFSVGHKDI